MINRIKKYSIALILLTFILFTGCSTTDQGSTPSSTTTPTVTTTTTATQIPAPTKTTGSGDAQTAVSGKLVVSYIDVGQADSILLQQGSTTMLIDAGNNADESTILNYINSKGIKKIDYLVGTHPHEDHIGSLDAVIKAYSIGKIYMPKVTQTTKTFQNVMDAISSKGMKVSTPTPGTTFSLGEAMCKIIAPNSSSYKDLNDYSVVIKVTYGNTSFLLDGDAEAISEMEMVNKGYDLKADVLKIGHHGSNSSTCANFLNAVNPKYAVISVGKNNDYGHPMKSTMDRLKNKNITVYRTDECGTIVATSDGKSITFSTKPGDYSYASTGSSTSSSVSSSNTGTKVVPLPTQTQKKEAIVYITNTGKKYHRAGCRYLSKSQIEITLSEAVNEGYTPCSVCNP